MTIGSVDARSLANEMRKLVEIDVTSENEPLASALTMFGTECAQGPQIAELALARKERKRLHEHDSCRLPGKVAMGVWF